MVAAIFNWILTLLFGTGGAITPTPVTLKTGVTFFPAAKPLTPVDDTMRVGIDLGSVTEVKKRAILSNALRVSEIADVKVEVCRGRTECMPMAYAGPYFSSPVYGIGFQVSGPQIKHATFDGVKVSIDRSLYNININSSNYSQ